MSGVFGIFESCEQNNIFQTANKMLDLLKHFDWTICEAEVVDQQIVLGRAGINIFNKSPQPVYNSDKDIALVMSGEIYNLETFPKNPDHASSLEEILLWLYEREGTYFIPKLNGAFILAVWDGKERKIILANDYMGFYPTYYSLQNGNFVFAPEVKAILGFPGLKKELDMVALSQYMRFQHLLGNRTFFEDIHLLPPASILRFDVTTGRNSIENYWSFADLPLNKDISFDDAVDETARLLQKAICRLSEDDYRPGVFLSGGLDSRSIIGFMKRRPVSTISFGHKDSLDVVCAGRIAKIAGSDHHWYDMRDGNWVLDYIDRHLELTEGFHSWIHSHGISTLDEARQIMDVNLIGWCGGTVMGSKDSIEPQQIHAVDNQALLNRLFYLFNQKYTWPSIIESEERLLYTEETWDKVRGLAFDSFREEFEPYRNVRKDIRGESFFIRNNLRRLTQNMLAIYRGYIEVRIPFFDYDLIQFLYSIPAETRGVKELYWAMIQRKLPRYVWVPNSNDELLPLYTPALRDFNDLGLKLKRRIAKYTHQRLFPVNTTTLYADYENYLRSDLRQWAEDILYSPIFKERGIFNQEFVKTLMKRHLSGNEEWTIGKIAPIITYEMMLRKYFD